MPRTAVSVRWSIMCTLVLAAGDLAAQGTLRQLQLDTPLRCAVGERLQLSLAGLDEARSRIALDPYTVRVRSSNAQVLAAAGRSPGWSVVDVSCRADGEAWVLVDAGGARAWTKVLVGAARSNVSPPAPPPESVWAEQVATTTTAMTTATPTRPAVTTSGTRLTATVATPVASLSLSTTTATVEHGATLKITATPYDGGGGAVSGRTVAWTSSDPTVASVDAAGVVTGVEPGGPVTIAARIDSATATATVAVTPLKPRPAGAGTSFATPIVLSAMSPGMSQQVSDYFASTADTQRFYQVAVSWKQSAGCAAGSPSGTTFTVTLTGIPAGRNFDLALLRGYSDVVQTSANAGTQDETITVAGVCGTTSSTYYVRITRVAGLPTSVPHLLKIDQSG
jgi:hypothetical protein